MLGMSEAEVNGATELANLADETFHLDAAGLPLLTKFVCLRLTKRASSS